MKREIKIDLVSDFVCPWCYIGEHRLQEAIRLASDEFEIQVNFKPFELNPDIPMEGVNHLEYLSRKFGNRSRVLAVHDQLAEMGLREGVEFHFDQIRLSPNTFQAHRLIWLAGKQGSAREIAKRLFLAFFAEGKNIGDLEELILLGTEAGIQTGQLREFFEGQEGASEVRALEQQSYEGGISGVPAFIIQDQYLVRGAQGAEVFRDIFQKIAVPVQEMGKPLGKKPA